MAGKAAATRKQTIDRIRMRWARTLLRLTFWVLRGRSTYNPVEIGGRRLPNRRVWEPRWDAIAGAMREYQAGSVLDIGCAEGWFLRRAAEDLGCFAIGVDLNERRVTLGETARLHDGVGRLGVMTGALDPDEIAKLPACDVVLCLSVLHHIFNKQGAPAAKRFLSAVAALPRKALIFEMGAAEQWAHVIAPHTKPDDFVVGLLAEAGLTNIRVIARTPNTVGNHVRSLFLAEPANAAPRLKEGSSRAQEPLRLVQ